MTRYGFLLTCAAAMLMLGIVGCKSEPEHKKMVVTETQHEGEVEAVSPGEMVVE